MTGYPDYNFPAFRAAAEKLRNDGHSVINPAELSTLFGGKAEIEESFCYYYTIERCRAEFGKNYKVDDDWMHKARAAEAIMSADLAAVRSCDAIYLLRGWESSRGAKHELAVAIKYGLKVILEGAAV
jgi:hypothetical protein